MDWIDFWGKNLYINNIKYKFDPTIPKKLK